LEEFFDHKVHTKAPTEWDGHPKPWNHGTKESLGRMGLNQPEFQLKSCGISKPMMISIGFYHVDTSLS
jgi:hypothetical protein